MLGHVECKIMVTSRLRLPDGSQARRIFFELGEKIPHF